MSTRQDDVLARLRTANPAAVDPGLAYSPRAQEVLKRILADAGTPGDAPAQRQPARRARRRVPRGLAIALAALIVGGGAAFASTDPLGWWSSNPTEAKYRTNPARVVPTPRLRVVHCQELSSTRFRCAAAGAGRTYFLLDRIRPPISLDRAKLSAYIARGLATGRLSARDAGRLRAELAAVPDSFFRQLQAESGFATYGGSAGGPNGQTLVPPAGVPMFLACEDSGRSLACRDVNGNGSLPVGAGVYMAERTADWRPAPPARHSFGLPPGAAPLTRAEIRLLTDPAMLTTSTTGSGGQGSAP